MSWLSAISDVASIGGTVASAWPYIAGAAGLASGGALFALPKAAPWIIAAVAVVGFGAFDLIEYANYETEKAARAADLAAAEKKAREAAEADAVVTKGLSDQLAAEIAA